MVDFLHNFSNGLRNSAPWLMLLALSGLLLAMQNNYGWITDYPEMLMIPLEEWINSAAEVLVANTRDGFRMVSSVLSWTLSVSQAVLVGLPWMASVALFTLIAWQGGGWRLAAFCVIALLYILVSGYWIAAMNTLSLVLVALPMAVMLGFSFGYMGFRSLRAQKIILPTLDLMQTVPAFAYLIPILLLFGFGPVVGLIASVIFAIPPMVRNTMLGFQRIPNAIMESARMSGCTRVQQFIWAEVPTAWPQMLIGVNQTTMAALSMVIIAAIIGGFNDIGWEVLSAMRKAQFGQSLLSGLVIVVLAILLDRITSAYAARQLPTASHTGMAASRFAIFFVVITATVIALSYVLPFLWFWPESWVYSPANAINKSITNFMIGYGNLMSSIKNTMLFYILLPVKIGFARAIVPFTWGIEFTQTMKILYWLVVVTVVIIEFGVQRWKMGIGIIIFAGIMYFGLTGLPWLSVLCFAALAGWQAGGPRLSLFAGATCLFLLFNGLWEQAMLSVYLCFVAVGLCIIFGGLIGIWAAGSNFVSSLIRPVNDMLQTLPQFVLLIPALMLFQVGDFTALLAIIAYAIVPMIRYTEHGLRSVPQTLVDAGVSSGCSPRQLFWLVKLPQAIPQILIGINQTVLYGLGMLVIAALVGTTGLGQAIYVALGEANAGAGLVAGLGMALIAMSVDRILQALIIKSQ